MLAPFHDGSSGWMARITSSPPASCGFLRICARLVDIPFTTPPTAADHLRFNFEIGPKEGKVMPQHGVNVLALIKGPERFVFLYDDESADQLLQTLGKYAADPELNFSWYDAATLSQRVRKLREAEAGEVAKPRNRIRRSAA